MASLSNPTAFGQCGGSSMGPAILAVTWVFTGIATLVVMCKIWARFKIIGQTGFDDLLTVVALVRE